MGRKTAAATHILLVLGAIYSFAYGADSTVSPLPEPPSAPPDFVFLADYEDGYHPFGNPWGELIHQGGVLEIIADPTFSGRGNVQRSAIGDKRNPPIEERPQILVYRLYPGIFFPFKPAPLQFSQDVWISQPLYHLRRYQKNGEKELGQNHRGGLEPVKFQPALSEEALAPLRSGDPGIQKKIRFHGNKSLQKISDVLLEVQYINKEVHQGQTQ